MDAMGIHVVGHVTQATQPHADRLGQHTAVGAVIKVAHKLGTLIGVALQRTGHLAAQGARPHHDGPAASARTRGAVLEHRFARDHGQPLQQRRGHRPGQHHVGIEKDQAVGGVTTQPQDGQHGHPGAQDVDARLQARHVEAVAARKSQRKHQQAQGHGCARHGLTEKRHGGQQGHHNDGGLHEGRHERGHRLGRVEKRSVVVSIVEHEQLQAAQPRASAAGASNQTPVKYKKPTQAGIAPGRRQRSIVDQFS